MNYESVSSWSINKISFSDLNPLYHKVIKNIRYFHCESHTSTAI